MRTHFAIILSAALGTALFSTAGIAATAQQSSMKTCAASWKAMPAADQKKQKYTDYMGTCMKAPAAAPAPAMKAAAAPAPAMAMKPAPAMKMAKPESGSAKCKDGKTVTFTHRSGTCSGHGGVATWM